MSEAIGSALAILLVTGAIGLLVAIIRFSIVSARRRRKAKNRLHEPNLAEVGAKWDVQLPAALEELYASPLVESREGYLAEPGADRAWHFYEFIPLTVAGIAEVLKVSGVPGIPIALDGDKGTYYLPFKGLGEGLTPPVLLRLPGKKAEDVLVSPSIEKLIKFEKREAPTD